MEGTVARQSMNSFAETSVSSRNETRVAEVRLLRFELRGECSRRSPQPIYFAELDRADIGEAHVCIGAECAVMHISTTHRYRWLNPILGHSRLSRTVRITVGVVRIGCSNDYNGSHRSGVTR
jgi:hypothetical protein